VAAHPDWNGNFFEGNDIAVLLTDTAAGAGVDRYDLYNGTDEVGQNVRLTGFGLTGTGSTGTTVQDGYLRQGLQRVDATMTAMSAVPGLVGGDRVLMTDFDNGLAANDAFGYYFGINDLGLGLDEVSIASGDSGSPGFIAGRIATVVSFGLRLSDTTLGTPDIDGVLNSSFGEYGGFTRVSQYEAWVNELINPVPEPGTFGIGALGAVALIWLRRRLA
jgi:hypothetical protein